MASAAASAGSQVADSNSLCLRLLDLPLAWLRLLLQALGKDEVLALFRSCTAFREHVLASRKLFLEVQLVMQPDQALSAQNKLLLACKYSNQVELRFFELIQTTFSNDRMASITGAQRFVERAVEAAGHALTAITSAEFHCMRLDSPVPSWLMTACPQLERLWLDECELCSHLDVGSSSGAVVEHGQLRELILECRMALWDECPWYAWNDQLSALSGLTSLTLTSLMLLPVITSAAVYNRLSKLSMPKFMAVDDAFVELATLPRLTHLACRGFQPPLDCSSYPVHLAELGTQVLDVGCFSRLPLDGIRSFKVSRGFVVPSNDLEACTRVASAVRRDGGLTWEPSFIALNNKDPHVDPECLDVLMHMLAGSCACKVNRFILRSAHVTPELLSTLAPHLAKFELDAVQFEFCSWAPDAWPVVLPSLPTAQAVHFSGQCSKEQFNEVTMLGMIRQACRPVKIQVAVTGNSNGKLLRDSVQPAMVLLGCSSVDFSVSVVQRELEAGWWENERSEDSDDDFDEGLSDEDGEGYEGDVWSASEGWEEDEWDEGEEEEQGAE